MKNFNMNKEYRYLREEDFDDELIDDIEDVDIEYELKQIGDKLGYLFTSSGSKGSFSISNNLEVDVTFYGGRIQKIFVKVLKNPARFDCTKNVSVVDNMSVDLQTCVLVIKEIQQKLL